MYQSPSLIHFELGCNDIVIDCKKNERYEGNCRLFSIIMSKIVEYKKSSKMERSNIISSIMNEIKRSWPIGGFFKRDSHHERWFEVGDHCGRDAISKIFREALHEQYKSSAASRKKIREEIKAKMKSRCSSASFENRLNDKNMCIQKQRESNCVKRSIDSKIALENIVPSDIIIVFEKYLPVPILEDSNPFEPTPISDCCIKV